MWGHILYFPQRDGIFFSTLNSFVTCLVKPFHFHTRSGSELKGGPFAVFIPSNIPHPTYHVNCSPIPIHVYEYLGQLLWLANQKQSFSRPHGGIIIMVGQSKTVIFSATWRDYYYGWPIKNSHFLSPVESTASWACLQAKLKGPLLMGSSGQMPKNQFGLI